MTEKLIPRPSEKFPQEMKQSDLKHIVRIANVDLPGNKVLPYALSRIKGIGVNLAEIICTLANVNKQMRIGSLKEEEVKRINQIIVALPQTGIPAWLFNRRKDYESGENKHLLSGDLFFAQDNDLKRLKKIKAYRGVRHIQGQPVRGQRTRSHFRKNKGKVVGVKKKMITPATAEKGAEKKSEKK